MKLLPFPLQSLPATALLGLFGLYVVGGGSSLSAQNQKVVHQAIELSESPSFINIDITANYEAVTWPMGGILVESNVKMYECKLNILEYLIKAGRYSLDTTIVDKTLHLKTNEALRDPIEVGRGGCHEEIDMKIYLPAGYYLDSLNHWSNPDLKPAEPLQIKNTEIDTLQGANSEHR